MLKGQRETDRQNGQGVGKEKKGVNQRKTINPLISAQPSAHLAETVKPQESPGDFPSAKRTKQENASSRVNKLSYKTSTAH